MKAPICCIVGCAVALAVAHGESLAVHEWGTFTSLQDEAGRTLGGINSDDEPVPRFCHDLNFLLIGTLQEFSPALSQGAPICHPDVTMRLETPVIYFHPTKEVPATATVKVTFRGGWLTQFYPAAVPGGVSNFLKLTADTSGTLAWNDLQLSATANGPETTNRVWTAPRAVQAASVTATNGESEKFLFYRGVGHVDCPLRVSRTADGKTLECRAQLADGFGSPMPIRRLWLASFRADGTCAFRSLSPVTLSAKADQTGVLFSAPAEFTDYSSGNLARLRREMHAALGKAGMFKDEADALLNTWELSYFKSAGLRLFFMVPRAWTDYYLPLEISVPSQIQRAMVGRLELVTPEQRALLKKLAGAPVPTKPWSWYSGTNDAVRIESAMPSAYRNLGRFRNALLLDELLRRPSKSLEEFVRVNRLAERPQ